MSAHSELNDHNRFHTFGHGPLRDRVPTLVGHEDNIFTFGLDNLYPQRVEQIVYRSPLANSAVLNLADFTFGRGFEDEAFAKQVVNEQLSLKINDLLRFNSWDHAQNNVFALHFAYNLNLEISNVTPIFSKYCRFARPEQEGLPVDKIRFSTNWENNINRTGKPKEVKTFFIFNSNPEVIQQQIIDSGGIDNYPGQILYATMHPGIYPRVMYDPALDTIQSNAEIGLYELSNIQNSFHPSMVFKYPGKFENEEQRLNIERQINNMMGSPGAGTVLLVETELEDMTTNFSMLEPITIDNRDKLFEFTSANVRKTILQSFTVPGILLGDQPDSGAVTQENMLNSYNYYNEKIRNRRVFMSDWYEKWAPFFMDNIVPANGNYTINPLKFIPTQQAPIISPTGQVFMIDDEGEPQLIESTNGNSSNNNN